MPGPADGPQFISDPIPPDRAVRLLRAKVGELEADVKDALNRDPNNSIAYLTADIALVAALLADAVERWESQPPR